MRVILIPIGILYSVIILIRNLLYDFNIFRSYTFNIPIICVGNLSFGGTGKTPHVEYILNLLKNKKTALLSRGYGRKTKGLRYVKLGSSSLEVGDESIQIKKKFPGCKIIVSENRRRGIQYILKEFPEIEVILMDDGFQHRSVKAGLNILLNHYSNPFYLDKIIPVGNLREYVSAARRADIIITSKCPKEISSNEKDLIIKKLELSLSQEAFFSSIKYKKIESLNEESVFHLSDKKDVILITSISSAKELINFLEDKGHCVNHFKFPDHYNYTKNDIYNIFSKFPLSENFIILTTEKDKVKLECLKTEFNRLNDFYVIPIEVTFNDHKKFDRKIINYVENHTRNN